MHLIQLRRLLSFHSARRVCSGCRFITAHRNVSSSLSGSSPVQLAYESIDASCYGEELPPLVILHGLFGSKTNWRTLGKHFHRETGRKIVTLDARNHGESEHSPEMNYFVQALDVCRLFQELELSKAVVMGHSMGGKTAMTLALSYPEYVQSLIVVDMSPTKVTLDDDIPQYLAAKRDMNLAFVNNKRDAERMLMNAVPNSFLRSFFLTNLVKSESGFKWRINLEGIESNISEVSGFPTQFPHQQFDGRTLFIGGSKSDYIQFKEFPSIKNLFPRASIKFIPDSGHWPHAEKPMEFAQIVTDFLDNCLQDHD